MKASPKQVQLKLEISMSYPDHAGMLEGRSPEGVPA